VKTRGVALLAAVAACGDKGESQPAPQSRLVPVAKPVSATPSVKGSVIDRDTREKIGNAEVVLRGAKDYTTRSRADGTFDIAVPRGDYRVFVRHERVMSTGLQGRVRLRPAPSATLANVVDEKLMPVLSVDGDTTGLELTVTAGATVNGRITNQAGDPIAGAVVSAVAIERPLAAGTTPSVTAPIARRVAARPVLGTDTVISDALGRFTLRVPGGGYELVAKADGYAGLGGLSELSLDVGATLDTTVTLVKGCIVTGTVTTAAGTPPHDGALETQMFGQSMRPALGFGPDGRIEPDGTFRWTSTDAGIVKIRAWPWQQQPSASRSFECSDGKVFDNVVLEVPNAVPDLAGTISDARGEPVPLAYLDLSPIDPGSGQQERADAAGRWSVFDVRAGKYTITASAPGRGIAHQTISSPRRDIGLRLSGAGRIRGTTTELVDGSFELTFHHCGGSAAPIELEDDARIVVVRGGQFTIDRVPACTLTLTARWRDKFLTQAIVIEPDTTAFMELAIGEPRVKQVSGTVRDDFGKPVADARITVIIDAREAMTVRSDSDGHYSLSTAAGAQIVASNGKKVGRALVGRANIDSEQVDLQLFDPASAGYP